MPRGYAGKFLDVDLTKEKIKETSFNDDVLEQYFGGRGLAAKILWDRIGKEWSKIDPLGPENIFIALTGPMTAIYPGARVCCSGKSPVSNGTVGSTASTEFASELKAAGYDGVIVSGKAKDPVYILVTNDGGELVDASHLWGKVSEEIIKSLNKEVTEELTKRKSNVGLFREPGKIYIGPAGENMVRNSAVCSKVCHAAGYGGYGAVMGSKNVKAIALSGSGKISLYDNKNFRKKTKEVLNKINLNNFVPIRRKYGTPFWVKVVNKEGFIPTRNYQEGFFKHGDAINAETMQESMVDSSGACFNCIISCWNKSSIKTGPHKGISLVGPEYETLALMGSNLGLSNIEDVAFLNERCNELGMDSISLGGVLGFAVEAYKKVCKVDSEERWRCS